MQLNTNLIKKFLDQSIEEDYGIKGDITSDAIIPDNTKVHFKINTRQDIILCGANIARYYFDKYSNIEYTINPHDTQKVKANSSIISGYGLASEILMLERVILNYLQHLSGISTFTNQFVQKVKETKVKIYDTRKTIPMYRMLHKYAVICGGGHNHRLSLDSNILIKDNHIAIVGSVKMALQKAKAANAHYTKIEIECDSLEQVQEALNEGIDIIMLDNMSVSNLQKAVKIIRAHNSNILIEASGNIALDTIYEVAKTGVNIISIGKITHSSSAVDIGLDIIS